MYAEQTTLEWPESVVGLHDEDRTPRIRGAGAAGFYSQVERFEPDHGAAGQEVQVEGTNLQCAIGVRVEQGTQSTLVDDKYFLIPDTWTRERARLIVLRDDGATRVEFSR